MPVRWSTAHYCFSRAPCTATLYRRSSLDCLHLLSRAPDPRLRFPLTHSLALPCSGYLSFSLPPSGFWRGSARARYSRSLARVYWGGDLSSSSGEPRCVETRRARLFLSLFDSRGQTSPTPSDNPCISFLLSHTRPTHLPTYHSFSFPPPLKRIPALRTVSWNLSLAPTLVRSQPFFSLPPPCAHSLSPLPPRATSFPTISVALIHSFSLIP